MASDTAVQLAHDPLRCVEFFAGLGGYSCALRRAGADALPAVEVVAVDRVCCEVFAHNHGLRPSNQSIEMLTAAALSAHRADLWCLSPPCQPFTREGSAKVRDDGDTRGAALLNLLTVIGEMDHPPRFWLTENVAGFVGTNSWRRMHCVLGAAGYRVEGYDLLCPSEQLGVPNIRLRYYCVAVLQQGNRDGGGSSVTTPVTNAAAVEGHAAEGGPPAAAIPRFLPNCSAGSSCSSSSSSSSSTAPAAPIIASPLPSEIMRLLHYPYVRLSPRVACRTSYTRRLRAYCTRTLATCLSGPDIDQSISYVHSSPAQLMGGGGGF